MRKEAEAQEHSLTSITFLIFHYCSLKMQLLKKKRCNGLQSLYPPTSDITLLSELWCFTTSFGNENSDIVLLSELEALSTSILDSNVWDYICHYFFLAQNHRSDALGAEGQQDASICK